MYLDSVVLIALLKPNDWKREYAQRVIAYPERLYTSTAALLEMNFALARQKIAPIPNFAVALRLVLPRLEFIPLEFKHVERAFSIQSEHHLDFTDAIHVSVCLSQDARMATSDRKIRQIPSLTFMD